jgi:acyl dehydratase
MTSTFSTPPVEVTQSLIDGLVGLGGYTHPLFNPGARQLSEGTRAPMPGQGVLLLMGGLVEQSGLLDHAIALLELREVRFLKMLKAPTTLHVEITPGASKTTSSGKTIQHYQWTAIDAVGTRILEAQATMLTHKPPAP